MRNPARTLILGMMLLSVILPTGLSLLPGNAHSASWRETKCALYQQHRDQTRATMPNDAMGEMFNQQEQTFIASGCTARVYVCPQSKAELDYANLMSVKMMNAGATGSFLPFVCQDGLTTDKPTQ